MLVDSHFIHRVAGLLCVGTLVACAQTEWVKQDTSEIEAEQALSDCQSLIIQPLADPTRKFSPPPDTSSLDVEQCMKNKGFSRVRKGESPREVEILSAPSFTISGQGQ